MHEVVPDDGVGEQPARVPGDWESVYPVRVDGAVHDRLAVELPVAVAVKVAGEEMAAAVTLAVCGVGAPEKRASAAPGADSTAARAITKPAGTIRPGSRILLASR